MVLKLYSKYMKIMIFENFSWIFKFFTIFFRIFEKFNIVFIVLINFWKHITASYMIFFDFNIKKLTRKTSKGSRIFGFNRIYHFSIIYGSFYGPVYHFSFSPYIVIWCQSQLWWFGDFYFFWHKKWSTFDIPDHRLILINMQISGEIIKLK